MNRKIYPTKHCWIARLVGQIWLCWTRLVQLGYLVFDNFIFCALRPCSKLFCMQLFTRKTTTISSPHHKEYLILSRTLPNYNSPMGGLNINPWMCFTYGKSYDAHTVSVPEVSAKLVSQVAPAQFVAEVSETFNNAADITHGLSPAFITNNPDSIHAVFKRIKDRFDHLAEPGVVDSPVDYIFALSYSSRLDDSGNWQLAASTWDEACGLASSIVGEGKKVRFWVDKVDRKKRVNQWSFAQIYPYLVWPVIFIGESFPDRFGSRSLRMWPAIEATAGLVGRGLFCRRTPVGSGPMLQTLVRQGDLLFNQAANPNRPLEEIMTAFAAHIQAFRFRDHATFHVQAFVELRHQYWSHFLRMLNGNGIYGPLDTEEPTMLSGTRHEVVSTRWQPVGNFLWTNDVEWTPMESGVKFTHRKKGSESFEIINPDFLARIFRTGSHRLDQRLACLTNEHGRKVLLLLEDNGGAHGKVVAYFRYPSFLPDEQAIGIVWDGRTEQECVVTRDTVQWPRQNL